MDNAIAPTLQMAARRASASGWTVAVTGLDAGPAGAGMAVARCLREAPDFRGRVVALGHGGGDNDFALPDPVAGADALLARIDEIRQEAPIDAIIPCLDAELPNYIALWTELVRRGIHVMLPDRTTLYSRNKDYLPALCAKARVATPRVRRITHEGFFDLKGFDGEFWSYPMVVKGIFCDAYVVHTPEEAKQRFHQVAAVWGYPVLVQEFVDGDEVALAALGDGSGAMLGAAMMKKLGSAGIAVDDPDLLAAGLRLMAGLKWRGPLEMEMLRDRSGKLHLIEINPRFPAWLHFAADAGRRLPLDLLALMQDGISPHSDLLPPSWWHFEPAGMARSVGWMEETWGLAGFGPLARFGNRGDHGVPARSSEQFACPTP